MSAVTTKFREMNGYDAYTHIVARIADLLVVIVSAYLAYFIRFGTFDMIERYKWAMLLGVIIATIIFPYSRVYQSWRGKLRVLLVYRLSMSYLMIGAVLLVFAFFSARGDSFSRIWVFTWIFSGTCISCLLRIGAYPVINHLRAKGKNRRRVLLIGDAHSCATAHEHIVRTPSAGFDISRVLLVNKDIDNELTESDYEFYRSGICIEHNEAEVWICLPIEEGRTVRKIQDDLSLSTSNIRYMPNMTDFRLINHNISTVADLYMLDMSCSPMTGWNRFVKASEDRVISALVLLLILPFLIIIAIAVKMTSRGPIFYRQERMSWNGTSFEMLKFRSMPMNAESNGVSWGGARQKKNYKTWSIFTQN
ncbi:sugar transferase [Cobetia marina]